MNQNKQTTNFSEIENETKLNSIINFWKNINPKKIKVPFIQQCVCVCVQLYYIFFLFLKADLEKSHTEMLHRRLRNKKHSSKILDLIVKLKNEMTDNVCFF
jgi:hypothetical protein